ncbi:MAG: response regulator transcription factor [Acidimicrobiales bacterium]|nr:response regulator transcription factor [Acidimicrobiales bacterium]
MEKQAETAEVIDLTALKTELPAIVHVTAWAAEHRPLIDRLTELGIDAVVCPVAGPRRPPGVWVVTPTELAASPPPSHATLVLGDPNDVAQQRQALRSGALGVVAADSPTAQLRLVLVAAERGSALLPEGVGRALATRLAEPPVDVELEPRQQRIVEGLADGSSIEQVATICGISERHARRELGRVWHQAGVPNRTVGLIEMARWGYLEP